MLSTKEKLYKRILILNERVWEGRAPKEKIDLWLRNFSGRVASVEEEQLHALFWLSQFMYFGRSEIRVLLKSLYRDLYFCPLIQELRKELQENISDELLELALKTELKKTRFFGIGNPSESGVHLLYYFRQENGLDKSSFMDAVQIFRQDPKVGIQSRKLRDTSINRYVFLDDICASGETAVDYSNAVVADILRLNPEAKVFYYSIFATTLGLKNVRENTQFKDHVSSVYELDSSYQCLEGDSRYFTGTDYPDIDRNLACKMVREYGEHMGYDPIDASGYNDSQMLIGFHHNTPDNTLPIIWHDQSVADGKNWNPIFQRYRKDLGDVL